MKVFPGLEVCKVLRIKRERRVQERNVLSLKALSRIYTTDSSFSSSETTFLEGSCFQFTDRRTGFSSQQKREKSFLVCQEYSYTEKHPVTVAQAAGLFKNTKKKRQEKGPFHFRGFSSQRGKLNSR